ncbi:MAG TPA: hypothetical protein VGJ80_09745 [Gemmatimonadales bacterium]
MRALLTLATAAILLFAMSCDEATRPRPPRQPFNMLHAYASTTHDTLYSFCGIEGVLPVPVASLPPWHGQATVWVARWVATTHGVPASRETHVTVSFSVTQDSNALVLTLGPPLDTTLTGSVLQAELDPTNGTWTCPAKLPFRDDAYLVSHGYQAAPTPSGNWSLRWMLGL